MIRTIHTSAFGDGSRVSIARNTAHSVLGVTDGHTRCHARVPLEPDDLRALAAEFVREADEIEMEAKNHAQG